MNLDLVSVQIYTYILIVIMQVSARRQRPHLHIPSCFLSFMAYWCRVINNFAEIRWKYNFSPRCAYQNGQSWPSTYHLLYYTIGGWPLGRLGWILMKINSQVWLPQLWGTSCAMIPSPRIIGREILWASASCASQFGGCLPGRKTPCRISSNLSTLA